MQTIEITELVVGNTADENYYSSSGELLLSKGTTITETYKDLLTKRNHETLYIKDALSEDDELESLLSAEFDDLDELKFDDREDLDEAEAELSGPAKALELPQFRSIKKGEEGLEQLNNSVHALNLDDKIKKGDTPDTPVGPALQDNAKEIMPDDRTEEYKASVNTSYDQGLNTVKRVLNSIANGDNLDGNQVRSVVRGFVDNFISDKNILMNLSTRRSSDEIYIYSHTLNVCLLSINIAASFGYSEEQVIEIGMGALLYDVGMLLIPKETYAKKGRLNADEWFEIQKHPIMGLHLLENVTRLPAAVPFMAYQAHERENATGYPKKRGARFIHKFSKIVQIADMYIALSSDRSYRKAIPPYKAMETIIKMTRHGLVSGEFVKALLSYTSLFPVGSLIELSDKRVAKVVKANGTSFAKPTVNVLTDRNHKVLPKDKFEIVDLSEETEVHIGRALALDHLSEISTMDGF